MKASAALFAVVMTVCILTTAAFAGCENDLLFGYQDGVAAVMQPLYFSVPKVMTKVTLPGGTVIYNKDQGVNFYKPSGSYQLRECRVQQVSISEGLSGGSYFGEGNPGYLDLTDASPHLHMAFVAFAEGTYFFEFKLTNVVESSGNPLEDSPVYLMVFTADTDYAQVDIKTAYRMADGSQVEISGLKSSASGVFSNYDYAQDVDRASGLGIYVNPSIDVGTEFCAKGTLCTNGVERYLSVDNVVSSEGGDPPRPMMMTTQYLGDPGEPINTSSTVGNVGLRITGLLVRVCGTIHYNGSGEAFIYDGCQIQRDDEVLGVKVSLDNLNSGNTITLPGEGSTVAITGISGVEEDASGKGVYAVIRPRTQDDVTPY